MICERGMHADLAVGEIERMEQFNDVISQENAGKVEKNWMIGKHIHQLKKKPHHLMEIFEGAWYGTVLLLGEKDRLPILTFTRSACIELLVAAKGHHSTRAGLLTEVARGR